MHSQNQAAEKKGLIGEFSLNQWFQENGVPYFWLRQDVESFLHTFSGRIKRPDFFVLLEGISVIAVDAKNYRLSCGVYTIGKEELDKAIAYEILTKMPFWFAFMHKGQAGINWYWISALKARSSGSIRTNRQTNKDFFAIGLSHFISIRHQEDFGRLFSHRGDILESAFSYNNLKALKPNKSQEYVSYNEFNMDN